MKTIRIDGNKFKVTGDADIIKRPDLVDCGMCGVAHYDIDMVLLETFPKDAPKKEMVLCKMCAFNLKKVLLFLGWTS